MELASLNSTGQDRYKDDEFVLDNKIKIDSYPELVVNLKISSKMETRQVKLSNYLEMTIKEFKDKYLDKEMMDGTGIRLINNGKEMRDSHKLKDHNL